MTKQEEAERYVASLMFPVLEDWDKCIAWSNAKLRVLGGQSPIEYFKAGKLEKLKSLVSMLRDTAGVGFNYDTNDENDDGA